MSGGKKSYLDDPRLDLNALGFVRQDSRNPEEGLHIVYYNLDITDELGIHIGTSVLGGDRVDTTTEIIIDGNYEVIPIENIYDLYILIAILKPAYRDTDPFEKIEGWGKVVLYTEDANSMTLRMKDFPTNVGYFNQFLLFLRQLYPQYTYIKKLSTSSLGDLFIKISSEG